MDMKASEGRVVIGEPLVSSAGGGGDGVHTLIVSPRESRNYKSYSKGALEMKTHKWRDLNER